MESDFLGETKVRDVSLNVVLWKFDEATSSEFLNDVPHPILSMIVNHPHLNASSEFQVFHVLDRWLEVDLKERFKFCLPLIHCLRTDSLSVEDVSTMLKYTTIKGNSEATLYLNTVLHQKQLELGIHSPLKIAKHNDCRATKMVRPTPRQLPVLPCVVGRINPKTGEKLRQKDFVPHLFVYKNKELVPYLSLKDARLNATHTKNLFTSLNSQGYQIISVGPVFYVTGGEFHLGKSNWNRYVWTYNTINGKWDFVCETI